MKKTLLLSLFAAIGLTASAQVISVTVNNKAIQNDEVITFYATEVKDDNDNIIKCTSGSETDPTLHNLTTEPLMIKGKLTKVTEGSEWEKINSVTWCHGSCTKIEDITEIGDFSYSADAFVEPDPTDWPSACPLHCEFAPGQYATAIAKIDLYATIGLSEEHLMTYYIKSVYDEAHASGINDLNTATTTFSLNGRNLLYNFSNAAPRILNLYSIDGRLAASYTINSEVGTLSLGTLPTGSYIINLEANGRTIKSEKILLGR